MKIKANETQNAAYVPLPETQGLTVPSRPLLKAGRDYLTAMLKESRQQKSTPETQLR